MNRKAIGPIIAIVVLLVLVVVAAGAAFYWKGFIEKHEGELYKESAKIDILGTHYNSEGLTIYMRNSGKAAIPIQNKKDPPTTLWVVRDSNYNIICSTSWSEMNEKNPFCLKGCNLAVSQNQIHEVLIKMENTICEPPAAGTETVYYFTIDFSGVATATGAFIKK